MNDLINIGPVTCEYLTLQRLELFHPMKIMILGAPPVHWFHVGGGKHPQWPNENMLQRAATFCHLFRFERFTTGLTDVLETWRHWIGEAQVTGCEQWGGHGMCWIRVA